MKYLIKVWVLSLGFMLFAALSQVFAQFEGTVSYTRYTIDETSKKQEKNGDMQMIVTPQRIMLKNMGNVSDVSIMGGGSTEGVLIRLDKEDFIFMTGNREALKISQADIQNLSGFMRGFSAKEENSSQLELKKTEDTKKMHGFTARKYILTDRETPNMLIETWLSKDININWGMLSDKWINDVGNLLGSGSGALDHFLRENALPMLIQKYENDEMTEKMEVTKIEQKQIPAAWIDVPNGTSVLTLQQFMMKKLSGN